MEAIWIHPESRLIEKLVHRELDKFRATAGGGREFYKAKKSEITTIVVGVLSKFSEPYKMGDIRSPYQAIRRRALEKPITQHRPNASLKEMMALCREVSGLSIPEVEIKTKISSDHINRLETGETEHLMLSEAVALANCYGITLKRMASCLEGT